MHIRVFVFHEILLFVFFLKDNASKLLLAVMESNDDTANAERILFNITPKSLVRVKIFLNKLFNFFYQIEYSCR